ncbi:MAG: indole-3-glycerol phosphate synthase, partial [Candidatus Taylorbacteria bacterium CG11_big_fil_rev_8_21_14_0_20_46_11]
SPSLGSLSGGSIIPIAKVYAGSGARAISVLTDEKYFSGSLSFLEEVRRICKQPILRKDFIIDPYQVYESKVAGADAILLIVAVLSLKKLQELLSLAQSLSLDALVEVHSKGELAKALCAGAKIIGINNRNLKTLKINLTTTDDIMRAVPKGTKAVFVSESGISTRADAEQVKKAGVHAILVGSAIMQAKKRTAKIHELSPL